MLKKTTSLRDGMLLEIAHQAHTRKRREKPYLITISEGSLNGRAATWRITVLDTVLFDPTRIFNDGDEFPEDFFLHYINNEGSMRVLSE
jgi:hypothetical protein